MSIQILDSNWTVVSDPGNVGRDGRWFEAARADAQPARVPGIAQEVLPEYLGVVWYYCPFDYDASPTPERRVVLRFGAVDYLAHVWLNGRYLGSHEGGETPFRFDVTECISSGVRNLLSVRVLCPGYERIDGIVQAEIPNRNDRDVMLYGGIMLPVEVATVPAVRISDIFARPDIKSGTITTSITAINDTDKHVSTVITLSASPAATGEMLASARREVLLAPGENVNELSVKIGQPRLWGLVDPYLYRVTAAVDDPVYAHELSVRCGFRDFRVVDGYFRLNGKRIFVKSTHTGNHNPIGHVAPIDPDLFRKDMVYAKASGFNMVRFIAGMAFPEQLDFCDELGLMVYEENFAAWCLEDSPQMAERFDRSVREMVLRDRNHPCITIWGLLNETKDGPVFRQAVNDLQLVRDHDDTRLVLLGSGRWDCDPTIGSVSNPGSREWEPVWGVEGPDAVAVDNAWDINHGGYFDKMGDAHVYPSVPHPPITYSFLRNLASETKPVFLSEYGIGSTMNAIRELRHYEQVGARQDLHDMKLIGTMARHFVTDWERWGFDGVYSFPEEMLLDSQRLHARQRTVGFNLIRSNPNLCGFNLTGMLDHGYSGEGVWTFWREWKPQVFDAIADGWSPLRWCLFTDPLHGYSGRKFKLEAILANEDVLAPGDYPVRFRLAGPGGVIWEKNTFARLPEAPAGGYPPLAAPVLAEEVVIDGPAGPYRLSATMERNGAPSGGSLTFHVSDPADLPGLEGTAAVWGLSEKAESWLVAQGLKIRQFGETPAERPEVILVGVPEGSEAADWQSLADRIAAGSTAVFISPKAFALGDDPVHWLPLENKGECLEYPDWLYHKECVAKRHPVFDGLQGPGVLDWDYYDQVIPHTIFRGQDAPDEVVAAAFAVGHVGQPDHYASGILVCAYNLGAGRLILNTFKVLEHLDQHPAADRLLINLVRYGQTSLDVP